MIDKPTEPVRQSNAVACGARARGADEKGAKTVGIKLYAYNFMEDRYGFLEKVLTKLFYCYMILIVALDKITKMK